MVRRAASLTTPPSLPADQALQLLRRQRQRADELLARDAAETEIQTWTETTSDALIRALGSDHRLLMTFHGAGIRLTYTHADSDDETAREFVRERLPHLDSAIQILEGQVEQIGPDQPALAPAPARSTVFIVHGHDDALRQQVARWLKENLRTGLAAVLLDEQPSEGRTLIEKFEHYAAQAAYVVVLMTADDLGGTKRQPGESEATLLGRLQARARQNVVFELGYFAGHLGRSHVALLYEEGVEYPSDVRGIVHIPADAGGGWKERLRTELRAAGLLR